MSDRMAGNFYLSVKTREDGTKIPFGKIGFTIQSDKTDKYVLANLNRVREAMQAGLLEDINGNVATNNVAIDVVAVFNTLADDTEIEQVGELRTTSGRSVTLADDLAPSQDEDELFE